MNLATFIRGVARRWYVVAAGLLLTAVACFLVYGHVGVTYQRDSTEVLIPGTVSYPKGDNPYLYIGNLSQACDVLVGALGAENVQDPITKRYPGTTITVARDQSTSGPMVSITVTAPSNDFAAGALRAIDAQIAPTLASIQSKADVPPDALMKVIPVTADTASQASKKTRLELTGLVGAVGLVVSLLAAALLDSLLLTWGTRRRAAEAVASSALPGFRITDSVADGQKDTRHPLTGGSHPAPKPARSPKKDAPVPTSPDVWSDN